MLMKTVVSLVALFTLQASASVTLVARSSLEILAARQTTGPCASVCAEFSSAVDTCTTAACLCTTSIASSLQACVNCAVTNNPTTSVISAAQSLIDTFKSTCSGIISPVLTVPAATPGTTPSTSTTSRVTTLSTTSTSRTVITTVTTQPNPTQTLIGPSSTTDLLGVPDTTPTGGLPNGITPSSGSKISIQKASIVAIGAMIGAALVL